jgi:hypothetical protein
MRKQRWSRGKAVVHCFGNAFLFICMASAVVSSASGQTNAYDDASTYTTGWNNGLNHGFGFRSWVLADNNGAGGGFAGTFVGYSGTVIDTGNGSLGMYANSGTYNYLSAYRSFSNSLTPGYVFRLKFKNGLVATGSAVGFSLLNGTGPAATNDIATIGAAARFSFYSRSTYTNYYISDGSGVRDSGIPFTYSGLSFEFTLRTADTYRLVVKSADGTATLAVFDGAALQNFGTLDSFVCYNLNGGPGGDAFFNRFQVSSDSLAPPVFRSLTETGGTITLSWWALTGRTYQLQRNTNVQKTNWLNLGSAVLATNTMVSATDAVGAATNFFYRVGLLP